METNYRKNMGIIEDDEYEEYVSTKPASENGSYCHLGLEAPLLQMEVPRTKRVIKFYFMVNIIIPTTANPTEYFICHGDQFHNNVFIAAVHEVDTPIPLAFLCVSADSYIAWMFPKAGERSTIPAAESWCMHNSIEFCLANIQYDRPAGESTGLTIHIPTSELFEEKAIAAIEQIAAAKQSGEYTLIFDILFSESSDNGNGSQSSKKRGPKAPAAALQPRERLPRGGLLLKVPEATTGGDKTPKVNVNKILGEVRADAAALKEAQTAEKAANSAKAAAGKAAKAKKLVDATTSGKGGKRKQDQFNGLPPRLPKSPKVAEGSSTQLAADSSTMLQPLVSALTAVVSKLAANSPPTVLPITPAEIKTVALPTRAELRIESKHDHILRQEMRMDELKYIKEMRSIFTDHSPIATASSSATATVAPVSMEAQTPPNINQDIDLNEAWRILSSADSWQNADEKDVILKDQFGASSKSDLAFLDSADMKMLVGKLKLVQANRLKRALKLI